MFVFLVLVLSLLFNGFSIRHQTSQRKVMSYLSICSLDLVFHPVGSQWVNFGKVAYLQNRNIYF